MSDLSEIEALFLVLVGGSPGAEVVFLNQNLRHRIYVQPINYPTVPRGTERLHLDLLSFRGLNPRKPRQLYDWRGWRWRLGRCLFFVVFAAVTAPD
jgi:hypothetical protein